MYGTAAHPKPSSLSPRTAGPAAAAGGVSAEPWRRLLAFDLAVLGFVQRWERRTLTCCMRALTDLGNPGNWLLLAAVLAAIGGTGPRCAALLGSGALVGLATSQALKRVCRRPRPSELAGASATIRTLTADPDAFSFPSGHTTVAFAVAVALIGSGSALSVVVLTLAAGIAISRVYLGAHYPLDVLAGIVLGAGSGWIARWLVALAL